MVPGVDCYFLAPTADTPNSRLPVLHYRGVLPEPLTEESATSILTAHSWDKRGTWGHIGVKHYHPNTHEAYGVFKGTSKLLIGRMEDDADAGLKLDVKPGDVIVLPAGTAHSSIESSEDYTYIGVYPENCPMWKYELGQNPPNDFLDDIANVPYPESDPIYGVDGPLNRVWKPETPAKA